MRIAPCSAFGLVLLVTPLAAVHAQAGQGRSTDRGGGYLRGPDSASTIIATGGAGTSRASNRP